MGLAKGFLSVFLSNWWCPHFDSITYRNPFVENEIQFFLLSSFMFAHQVSICKFKFTGGAKPSLEEKKMMSVDSGGHFRQDSPTIWSKRSLI